MKREKIHYAERGNFSATGASKSEAKANLEGLLDWYCAQSAPTIESRFGLTLVIVSIPTGWQIEVFDGAEIITARANLAAVVKSAKQRGALSIDVYPV